MPPEALADLFENWTDQMLATELAKAERGAKRNYSSTGQQTARQQRSATGRRDQTPRGECLMAYTTVTVTDVKPGDYASHKYRDLDRREVTRIEGDQVWLYLLTGEAGPFPADNYTFVREREG